MKKYLALFLSIVMLLALCACGDKPESGISGTLGDAVKGTEKVAPDLTPKALTDGCWVAVSYISGDTSIGADALDTDAEELMTAVFREDGSAYILLHGLSTLSPWEETADGCLLDIYGAPSYITRNDDGTLTFVEMVSGADSEDGQPHPTGSTILLENRADIPPSAAADPLFSLDLCMTAEETALMSSFMNGAPYFIEGNTLYGLAEDGGTWHVASRTFETKPGEDFPTLHDDVVYLDDAFPGYITKHGDTLYYIAADKYRGDSDFFLRRVNIDGSGKETLYDRPCDCLSIWNDRLYFTDENHYLVSTDLNGGDMQTLLAKPVYFAYPIGGGWFIYQDDGLGECLVLGHPGSGTERVITSTPSFCPTIVGNDLYYITMTIRSSSATSILCKMDLLTQETEIGDLLIGHGIVTDGHRIWTTNANSAPIDDWKTLTSDEYVSSLHRDVMYITAGYSVEHERSGGVIREKYLYDLSTSGGTSFR